MSQQLTFADSEFSSKRRLTRKEIFLSRMDTLLPWPQLLGNIEPVYPKAGNGRRPYSLETMFRIHCLQLWYSLGDEAMEDALYEIASMRQFALLSLDKAIPDRTTIMNFRHLLEKYKLTRKIFQTVNQWLLDCGVMMTQGTLVDATIIEAPSSTKNKNKQRDPDMHQTKKGNQKSTFTLNFEGTELDGELMGTTVNGQGINSSVNGTWKADGASGSLSISVKVTGAAESDALAKTFISGLQNVYKYEGDANSLTLYFKDGPTTRVMGFTPQR